MDEEARLDAKIRDLRAQKKKLHVQQRERLYREAGKHFLDYGGQQAINEHNYKDFKLMSQNGWNKLHIAANHMYRDSQGSWRLQPGSQEDLTQWMAEHFRDERDQNGGVTHKEERGRASLGNKSYTFEELGRQYHLNPETVASRYYRGVRGKELVQATDRNHHKLDRILYVSGKPFTLDKLSHLYGLAPETIMNRYYHGQRDYKLIQPIRSHNPHRAKTAHHVSPLESVQKKRVRFQGKFYTLQELGQEYGLPVTTLSNRYYQGKKGDDLVRPRQRRRVHLKVNGQDYTFQQLSRAYNIRPNILSNRYYHYHLRGDELVHPRWLNEKFTIYGKTYTLPDLGKRYHTKVVNIIRVLQARYQQGKRGNDLLHSFEEENGPIDFKGHHYTLEELGRQYHLPPRIISNRYYNQKMRGDDLVHPQEDPNQMSLTESTTSPVSTNEERQEKTSNSASNTQAAYQELTDQKVTLHGNIIGKPQYKEAGETSPKTTFIVIASHMSAKLQQVFPGGFIACTAQGEEAQAVHHKTLNFNRVRVVGNVQAGYYHGHRQNEFIVDDIQRE